ncbi:MAG: amino acid permease [Candidatus Bathyarchaeia archaeon]
MKKRKLKFQDIVIAGLSGAIGFEVFALLNYAYFNLAGSNIIYAILIAGAMNLLIMLSYCELSAAIPEVGGEYTYIKTAFGKYVAFMAGCFRWLASVFGAALAALTFAVQFTYLTALFFPNTQNLTPQQTSLIATIVVIAYAVADIRGTRKFENITTIILIILFAILIIGGLGYTTKLTEPQPATNDSFLGVFAAMVYVFPMFFGVRSIITLATTTENPEKNIPRGLLTASILIIPLYALLAYVTITVAPQQITNPSMPLIGHGAEIIFGKAGGALFAIMGMAACLLGLGTALTVESSIEVGMSRDGYFPKMLLKVHPRFGTYYIAVIVGAVVIAVIAAIGAIPIVGYAASFGSLIVFALVNLSLIKLRKTKPHLDRPFKTPLYPFIPVLGSTLSIVLLVVPLIIGDANAVEALISSGGLILAVTGIYYLRIIGRLRLQVAIGGIGVGSGISAAILAVVSEAGLVQAIFPFMPNCVLLVIGIILIVGGVLNINAGAISHC